MAVDDNRLAAIAKVRLLAKQLDLTSTSYWLREAHHATNAAHAMGVVQ